MLRGSAVFICVYLTFPGQNALEVEEETHETPPKETPQAAPACQVKFSLPGLLDGVVVLDHLFEFSSKATL